uniref:Uncharacterized protein n=1 Tax=Solanum demissum TaxID=50514 RepID=Q0KIJ6_SOLDE|nr:hypothetical protein SDM1_52t00019 [Solanum demissum]
MRRRVNVRLEKEEWAGERRKLRAVVRGRGEMAGGEEERSLVDKVISRRVQLTNGVKYKGLPDHSAYL